MPESGRITHDAGAEAGQALDVRAFLRAHPAFLADNPDLYQVLDPPARVHGAAFADHMAAMLDAQRAHATAMQAQAGQILAAGRAAASMAARVQEAVLALIEQCQAPDTLAECISAEFPRTLAVDAASLCAERLWVEASGGARALPDGAIDLLLGPRCVAFTAPDAWRFTLHGEGGGLAAHQALIRVPGHNALIALAARDAAVLDPSVGAASWHFLGRAVAAALAR